jgi:hypothetical protein
MSPSISNRFKKKTQSQPLRIEHPQRASFITSRCVNSRLWFVNNPTLEQHMLGYLAKYREKYNSKLYAFVFQGNHYHNVSRFPGCNRAAFQRDFNARFAEAVRRHVANFPGGPLFHRRYSAEALPNPEDIEEQFFYAALQPIRAGLVEFLEDYPAYNSFHDAIWGRESVFRVFRQAEYNERQRFNKNIRKEDFIDEFRLKYDRLPGYEHLSQKEYAELMLQKFEQRRKTLVDEFKAKGHKFLKREDFYKTVPGSAPKTTKKSTRSSKRPLVLSKRPETIRKYYDEHFDIYWPYKDASARYLRGEKDVVFPPGTYKPPGPFNPYPDDYAF